MGWHTGVNGIRQLGLTLLESFNDRSSVYAGRSAESVGTENRITRRNGHMTSARCGLAIILQLDQVVIDRSKELQVDQHLIHRRISNALTNSECAPVNYICSGLNRGKRIDDAQTSIIVPMPADQDVLARWLHDFFDNVFHKCSSAGRRSVPYRIGQYNMTRATIDGCRVETLDRLRESTRRVFRDVHHRHT